MEEVVLSEGDVPGSHFTRDPEEYSVLELKRWLECHGGKKSGRKQELVDRIRSFIAIKKGIDPKVDGGKWYEQKRQERELLSSSQTRNIETPEQGWGTFPTTDIPMMFNYGHVYQYLIESVAKFGQTGLSQHASSDSEDDRDFPNDSSGYTSTARPLRKGMNLMKSGFVNDMLDHTDDNYYFCKGHVHHSMKNELPLAVEVVLSHKSGSVQQATCTCKASAFGRCAHVSALLLKIVKFVEVNGTKVKAPSTSKPCQWNRGKKRAKDPTVVHYASYDSKKASKLRLYDWDPRPMNHRNNFSNEHTNSFLRNLQEYSSKTNEVSMWELSLTMKYEDYTLEEERKTILKTLVNDLEESLKDVFTGTGDQVEYTEIPGTKEQSASLRWFEERRYRITASKCKTAYSCGEKLLCERGKECLGQLYNWIRNKFWFPKHITTKDIEYGIETEATARDAYKAVTGNCISESGIWVCNRFPYLGASPDGLIKDANAKIVGVIEIKCLKIFKEKSIQEVVEERKQKTLSSTLYNRQCFKIEDDKLLLRESHPYYFQIQLQLLVTGCQFCDFVLYSAKGPPSIQRINENKTFQGNMEQALSAFWHRVLIPDFFEMRVPRELKPFILP